MTWARKVLAVVIGMVLGLAVTPLVFVWNHIGSWLAWILGQGPKPDVSTDLGWTVLFIPFAVGATIYAAWPRPESLREAARGWFK